MMTDQEALAILGQTGIQDIDSYCKAISIAANRLEKTQWRDYNPKTFNQEYRVTFGMRVILGLRYADDSKGSAEGMVLYDVEKGFYLALASVEKCDLTNNAVIEKWMLYPQYN